MTCTCIVRGFVFNTMPTNDFPPQTIFIHHTTHTVCIVFQSHICSTDTSTITSNSTSHSDRPLIFNTINFEGGYYIAMACDEIVAEELTVTGSIGVVSSKFNAGELNVKLGVGVDTISKGRYAEVRQILLTSTRNS